MGWLNDVENREERTDTPKMSSIDKERLRQLAFNPNLTGKDVLEALGFNNYATFSYQLDKDPELRAIYTEGREAAAKSGQPQKVSAKKSASAKSAPQENAEAGEKPKRKYKARRASKKKSATPPRNGNAKGQHKELLKRLQLEFDHIGVYGTVSEHFEELKTALAEA